MDGLRFREICESDYAQMKELHEALFPVRYGEDFYQCITRGQGLNGAPIISWLAVDTSACQVVGFVIAQFVPTRQCEDESLLDRHADEVCYIMTLGTRPGHGRRGEPASTH